MIFPKTMLLGCAASIGFAMTAAEASAAEMRVVRGAGGEHVRARFEGLEGNSVQLRREDWKTFETPLELLAADDQERFRAEHQSLAATRELLNKAAGHELATLVPFDGREAEPLAQTLGLRPESKTSHGASWRSYAAWSGGKFRLFGAMPYSIALYSDGEGNATSLSIVYANKGDFGSTAGFGADHFAGGTTSDARTLAAAMKRDETTVIDALTSAVGEPRTQRFGEGRTRRTVSRWDWHGYSFLLSHEDGEYVGLMIVSTEAADGGGRSERIANREIRDRLAAGVNRTENGDVWLSEIPMVDQGPKGYCVPATFERVMRAMGVEADMYLLAMIGGTSAGGGTSVERLMENVDSQVRRKGRRTRTDNIRQLRIRDVKRHIDAGVPVMWTMSSMDEYNRLANENTAARARGGDDAARIATMRERAASLADLPVASNRNHICMIIGYNETTQELAVSDSWGPRYELRWVPLEAAQWVSRDRLFYILP
jgi:hypothetical protein